jgi:hypothetical protein
MIRTNVVLPEDLKRELQYIAKRDKKSFSQVVREAAVLYTTTVAKKKKKNPFRNLKPIPGFKMGIEGNPSSISKEIDQIVYGPNGDN